MASGFTNIKYMIEDTITKRKGKWYNAINDYRQEIEITWEQLEKIDRLSLKKLVRYDTETWKEGMRKKQV